MDRIKQCIFEYRKRLKTLGIETISDVNRIIDEGRVSKLVEESEAWHRREISDIANRIVSHIDKKRMILISGPSSSGKTTFAARLVAELKKLRIGAVLVSLDDYYLSKDKMPKLADGSPDFEALESIDYMAFNTDVKDLIDGNAVDMPTYDFMTDTTTRRSVRLNTNEIIIVEGIHGLNPKIAANISHGNKYRIYCSALIALKKDNGEDIKSRVNRLIRRLIRDSYFRNSSFEFTLDLWDNVELGARQNIFPYTDSADIIFNSALLYEMAVYRVHFEELFKCVGEQDKHYTKLLELKRLLEQFSSVSDEYIPQSSILREFIGQKIKYK